MSESDKRNFKEFVFAVIMVVAVLGVIWYVNQYTPRGTYDPVTYVVADECNHASTYETLDCLADLGYGVMKLPLDK